MQPGPPRRRRSRAVAGALVDDLLDRSEDLAKGWLLALLEDAPLDDAPAILSADLVRDGPRVCEAAVRALADDQDLRRIERGGTLESLVARTGAVAGAGGMPATLRAVDALQAVIWSALRDGLRDAHPDEVAEVAQRLALVSDCIRVAALREPGAGGASLPSEPGAGSSVRPVPEALWLGALDEEILQARRSGKRLSLLLVELEDAERLLAVERLERAGATFGRFAHAVRGVLRRRDLLARESDARTWIIARDTGRAAAETLADRIAEAVAEAEVWRGAPLRASVGVAVLGEDGEDRDSLLDAAEEDRFAAAAQGTTVGSGGESQPSREE